MDVALKQAACGDKQIIRAKWAGDRRLKVTCSSRSPVKRPASNAPNVTPGATNLVGFLAPALGLGAAAAAVAAGSGSANSTNNTSVNN